MACWLAAGIVAGGGLVMSLAFLAAAALLAWQVVTLKPASPANALVRFKANHWVGLALTLAFLLELLV
ncbi:MAG TPA: 4-hydroxybenzoate octaprenyltransferase, partial [Devosia sp.]|nr:4-hydroxybenzoate octaprenyltransferase [Devosia sp.]